MSLRCRLNLKPTPSGTGGHRNRNRTPEPDTAHRTPARHAVLGASPWVDVLYGFTECTVGARGGTGGGWPPVGLSCIPSDVLYRQYGIGKGRGLLFRENEQTARQGSRAASALHGTRCASSTSTGRRSAAVLNFKVACRQLRPLRNYTFLRHSADSSGRGASTAKLVAARASAAFARDRRAWCH